MMIGYNDYGEEQQPRRLANKYIPPVSPGQKINPVQSNIQPVGGTLDTAPGGPGPGGGYYKPPSVSYRGGAGAQSGVDWASENYSPQLMGGIRGMYGQLEQNLQNIPSTAAEWRGWQPESMADMYRGFMQGSPELEQMEYNRALARLKGQTGTAMQNLATMTAAGRSGAGSGAYQGGVRDINRALMGGTGKIATQQAMKNMMDMERRQKQLIGYTGGDITNRMGWLGGLTGAMGTDWQAKQQALGSQAGWYGQQIPFEQFNIQTPYNRAASASAANANLALRTSQMEQDENYRRRQEGMGWVDQLMGWQGQLGGQYYAGQGQYGDYGANRARGILGGYDPSWLPR